MSQEKKALIQTVQNMAAIIAAAKKLKKREPKSTTPKRGK